MRAPGAAIWGLALIGSALVHLGGVLLILPFFTPRPIPPQPTQSSPLTVQSEPIRQSTAQPADTKGEVAPAQTADGAALSAGSVPTSTATALPPPSPVLAAATATGQPAVAPPLPAAVVAADTPAAPQAPSVSPAVAALAASPPTGEATPAAALPQIAATSTTLVTSAVLTSQPATTTTLPTVLPAVAQTPAATPSATSVAQARLPATTPTPQTPPAETVPPQPPQGDAITATLAFLGDSQDIDAQSLAAFQSFTQPGDLTAAADPLRDGVAQILGQVPCARLQVEFDADTATLALRGHVPDAGLKPPVLALLQQQMGGSITVSDQMALLPRPQCGALKAIENVGLPQSTDQITNPALLGTDAHVRIFDFRAGDLLFLDLTGPDYPAFVYVDYLDAGGNVLHLSPNDYAPLIELTPKQPFAVGARAGQTTGLQLKIAPPFGQEIVVAFAASHPLYEASRPLVEPAAPYLNWLRTQVAEQRATLTDFKGEWVYFLVSTGP